MPLDVKQHGMIIEAEVQSCVVEIFLNGFPVGLCGLGGSRKFSRPVHEFLVDGRNDLAVLVNPGDSPSRALLPSKKSRAAARAQPPPSPLLDAYSGTQEDDASQDEKDIFGELDDGGGADASSKGQVKEGDARPSVLAELVDRDFWLKSEAAVENGDDAGVHEGLAVDPAAVFVARLSKYKVGAMAFDGTGERIIQVAWRARDELDTLTRARAPYPRWVTSNRNLGPMFGPQHWQEATPLKLDERTKETARQFVLNVRQAIEDGEADPVLAASKQKFTEVAAAYGISAEKRAAMFRQLLTSQADKPNWVFEYPTDDEIDLRLVAGDRLLECVGPDWKPIIRAAPSGEDRFMYPMFIGMAGGKWVIMR